jgi:branched-chain amino acid transport system ATP-binding protein
MSDTMLEVIKLSKAFGGILAVSNLSFRLERGQIKAIIGPNGAGKTTCLNLISGIFRPISGEILFKGKRITALSAHQRAYLGFGRTFQNIRLFTEGMTVVENVIAGRHTRTKAGLWSVLLHWHMSSVEFASATEEALKWLDFVGLLPKAKLSVSDLTFAEQRSLELARALAGEPELLLLDEVAAGLNEAEAEHAADHILQIRDRLGITICLVEHNMNLVMNTADDILVLNYGCGLAEGKPSDIQNNPDVIRAYLGEK